MSADNEKKAAGQEAAREAPPAAPAKSGGGELAEAPPGPGPAAAPEAPEAVKPEAKAKGPGKPRSRYRDHESRELLKVRRELGDLQTAFERLEEDRDTHRSETAAQRDKYLRSLAEMENLRKRLEREKNDYYLYALSGLLKQLVAVVDNFDRALKARDQSDAKALAEGIEMIHKQILDILQKQGVTSFRAAGQPFDPSLHQAIQTEEAEGVTEPVVGEELQPGYKIGDRLLRPALVKVRVPKAKTS